MMLLFLRLISATLVAATLLDDAKRHPGRRLYRTKRRVFADEDLFFGDGLAPIANTKKRNMPPVQMLNPKRVSPTYRCVFIESPRDRQVD